jgi:hypothetical protein
MDEQQPRIPGVKYRRVTRYRTETTVIDGVPSTRRVPYADWEPVPPRDWDEVVLRGITAVAILFTVIAVVATTASVGGLLSAMVPALVAYAMGAVFTLAWLYCLGFEWLDRIAPHRARPAKVAGVVVLLISMGAVFTYGYGLGQPWAGGFGATIDLLAKGSWWLLLRQHAVPLDEGVAHWVTDQEQRLAGRELLSARLLRLNRRAAYQRAVGGTEFQAATAILAAADTSTALGETSGQRPGASGRTDTPAPEPVPAPAPAPPAPPVPPASGRQDTADTAVPATSGHADHGAPTPHPTPISGGSMAATVRQAITDEPAISDEVLTDLVRDAHGDRPNLADTVRRTRAREVAKLKKRPAS